MTSRTHRIVRFRAIARSLLICVAGVPGALAADGSAALLAMVEAPSLERKRGVRVENVEIDMGPGALAIGSGVLVPAAPVSDHSLEMVFIGDARFRIDPEDPVEFAQLELFANEAPLAAEVTHAVLVLGDATITERLVTAGRAEGVESERLDEAETLFAEWAASAQRRGFAVPAAIVKVVSGDSQATGYFAAWCRSPELGDFYYSIEPWRSEQVSLGQFIPIDDLTRNRIRQRNERGKWFGRFADLDLLGDWDTWVSTSLVSSDGRRTPGSAGFEPEHYTLDVSVDPRYKTNTSGTARIRARAVADAGRAVDLELYSGLRVTEVYESDDQPLEWIRFDDSLTVLLDEPVGPGETIDLRIEYEGTLVQKIETYQASRDKPFRLLSTDRWYPRVGSVDRATYDVTLRAPDLFDLVGSGRVVESGMDGGIQWQRRLLEVSAIGFSFEIGRFDFVTDRAGHVELTFAFPRHRLALKKETRQRIVDTTKAALTFFEERFGPYPLDSLTVAVVFRGFSQGYLSFVTLAEPAMYEPRSARRKSSRPEWADEVRDLTIAHELSHQWWGNWVGWGTYRDQWLSEALAEYSSLMFGATRASSAARFLIRNAVDWRSSVRRVESLGPVTLGYRLQSSKGDGYRGIVYDKGAVVIRMLARLLGEEPFAAMLGELAKAVGNRTVDTDTFVRALERMSGLDLSSFAERFVYGTDIPDVYYRYAIEQATGQPEWVLRGQAFQVGGGSPSYSLRYTPDGGWRVESRFDANPDVEELSWVVPFQIVITSPDEIDPEGEREPRSARGYGGKLLLQGATTQFEYVVPERPERMDIDQFGEVLARFYDEGLQPKRALLLRARSSREAGDLEAAASLLREALTLPMYSERGLAWSTVAKDLDDDELEERENLLDDQIHTLIARVRFEQGDLEAARRELLAAEAKFEQPKRQGRWNERRILWSRLDLEEARYESAFQRLKEKKSRFMLGAEGYAILVAASHETGRKKIVPELLEAAERRGADVSALRTARAVRPTGE